MRQRLLDAFCGAGGCSMGYHRAGFDVVGVDIKAMPRYPFEFHQGDALEFIRNHGHEFDVIHASPPCQAYSSVTPEENRDTHPDLLQATRDALEASGRVWVIENVVGAPVRTIIQLCGSSFGLDVRRHRLFESNVMLMGIPCNHDWQTPRFQSLNNEQRKVKLASVVGVHGSLNYSGEREIRERAMGIDWMSVQELTQAIPPAYTEYIGRQLIEYLQRKAA